MKNVVMVALVTLVAINIGCASIKLGNAPEMISARTYNSSGLPATPKITAVVPGNMFLRTATPEEALPLSASMLIKDKRTKGVLFIIVRNGQRSHQVAANYQRILSDLDTEFDTTYSTAKGFRFDYQGRRAGYKTNNRTIIRESAFYETVVICEAYSFKGGGKQILDELETICQSVKLAE